MKKIITFAVSTALVAGTLGFASLAFASNPSGTGQPNQSCQDQTTSPQGFNTAGFAHAETVYAGSDGTPSLAHAHSTKAVSQYDVACYQLSN